MPGSGDSVRIPVSLQVDASEYQSIIADMKQTVNKLAPDSKAFAGATKELAKLEREADAIALALKQGFNNPGQIEKFEQKIRALGLHLQSTAQNLSKVKFEDLNLNLVSPEELDKLKQLQAAVTEAQNRVQNFQTNKMKELVTQSAELAEGFKDLKLDINTTDYDTALKKAGDKLQDLQDKATKSAKRVADAQIAADKTKAAITAREHAKGIFNLNKTQYNEAYFKRDESGKVTQFKSGGRKLLEAQLEEWGLTPEQLKEFKKQTVESLSDFYSTIESTINNKKNIEKLDKKNADAQKELIDAQNEQSKIDQVTTSIQQLIATLQQLYNIQDASNVYHAEYEQETKQVQENTKAVEEQKEAIVELTQVRQESNESQKRANDAQQDGERSAHAYAESEREIAQGAKEAADAQKRLTDAIKRWFSFREVINLTKRAVVDAVNHIKELDATMTQIAVVTNMTQSDLWDQIGIYSAIAQQYGVTTNGVYQVSQLYYQQGLQTADVMKLTTETLKMAKIANLDYATATDYMTVAIRGFKMEMDDAQRVTDVYSRLAAVSASDTEELAVAMSKTASSAAAVGSSFENTSAMIALMVETTREAPENIGSAMKSIISRYGELKESPSKLIDSEGEELSFNKVDAALQSVGVSMHDANGQFREFDQVILDLSKKWQTLDRNTQRYIATVMAGNRQQSRFLALVSDYDRLAELTEEAANAQDAGTLQYLKTLDSLETKMNQLKVAFQEFYTSMGLEDIFKGALDTLTGFITKLNSLPKLFNTIPITAIGMGVNLVIAIKNVLTLLAPVVSLAFSKLKSRIAEFTGSDFKLKFSTNKEESVKDAEKTAEAMRDAAQQKLDEKPTTLKVTHETRETGEVAAQGFIEKLRNNKALRTVIGSTIKAFGATASAIALTKKDTYSSMQSGMEGSKVRSGLWGIGGNVLGGFATGGWVGAAIGLIQSIPNIITLFDGLNASFEERMKQLNQEIQQNKEQQILKKNEINTLTQEIDKLDELKQHRYDSNEANEEYISYMAQIANSHEELIGTLDAEGNVIIQLNDLYGLLIQKQQEQNQLAKQGAENQLLAKQDLNDTINKMFTDHLSIQPSQWYNPENVYNYSAISKFGKNINGVFTFNSVEDLFDAYNSEVSGFKQDFLAGLIGSIQEDFAKVKWSDYGIALEIPEFNWNNIPQSIQDFINIYNTNIIPQLQLVNTQINTASNNLLEIERQNKIFDWAIKNENNIFSSVIQAFNFGIDSLVRIIANVENLTEDDSAQLAKQYLKYQNIWQDLTKIFQNPLQYTKKEYEQIVSKTFTQLDKETSQQLQNSFNKQYIKEYSDIVKNNTERSVKFIEQFGQNIASSQFEEFFNKSISIRGDFDNLPANQIESIVDELFILGNQYFVNGLYIQGNAILDEYMRLITLVSNSSMTSQQKGAILSYFKNTNFTDLESLDELSKNLTTYGEANNLDLSEYVATITTLETILPNNVNTLVNNYVSQLKEFNDTVGKFAKNASKGLSYEDATAELAKLQITEPDLLFSDIYEFEESVGAFVYTLEGYQKAQNETLKKYNKKYFEISTQISQQAGTLNLLNTFGSNGVFDSRFLTLEAQILKEQWESSGKTWDEFYKEQQEALIKGRAELDSYRSAMEASIAYQLTGIFKEINFEDLINGRNLKTSTRQLQQFLISKYPGLTQGIEEAANTYIAALTSGGQNALNAYKELIKDTNIQFDYDVAKTLYLGSVPKTAEAITELLGAKVGDAISKETAELVGLVEGIDFDAEGNLLVLHAAEDFLDEVMGLYNKVHMQFESGQASLADLNASYAALVKGQLQPRQDAIDLISKSAELDIDDLELYANLIGKPLQEILKSGFYTTMLGNGKFKINQSAIDVLINQTDLDRSNIEVIEALQERNEAIIEYDRQIANNIKDTVNNLVSANVGDTVDITALQKIYGQAINDYFSGNISDGFAKITTDTNIPGLIRSIINATDEGSNMLQSDIAELQDVLNQLFQSYSDLISKGISGTLSNTEALNLSTVAKQLGIDTDLDFTKTKEGLKLSQQSAFKLYDALKQIDHIAASIVLDNLVDSLEKTDDGYHSITETMVKIHQINEQLKTSDAEQTVELKKQLLIYNEIAQIQMRRADSYSFMDNALPEGMQGPENYWNAVGQAYKTMNESAQSGYMEIQDFYNIVNEMNNLAALSGNTLEFMGQTLSGEAKDAADLITMAMDALTNVDGEGVKIKLSELGGDLSAGAESMAKGFDVGIQQMAQSQIDMLDAEIALLEAIVAMEELGDIDVDHNGLQITEIYDDINNEFFGDFDEIRDKILTNISNNEKIKYLLDDLRVGNLSLRNLLEMNAQDLIDAGMDMNRYSKIMDGLYKAAISGDFDLDNLQDSLMNYLEGIDEVITYTNKEGRTFAITPGGEFVNFSIDSAETQKRLADAFEGIDKDLKVDAQAAWDAYIAKEPLTLEQRYAVNVLMSRTQHDKEKGYYAAGKWFDTYGEAVAALALQDAGADMSKDYTVTEEGIGTATLGWSIDDIKVNVDSDGIITYNYNGQEQKTIEELYGAIAKKYQIDEKDVPLYINMTAEPRIVNERALHNNKTDLLPQLKEIWGQDGQTGKAQELLMQMGISYKITTEDWDINDLFTYDKIAALAEGEGIETKLSITTNYDESVSEYEKKMLSEGSAEATQTITTNDVDGNLAAAGETVETVQDADGKPIDIPIFTTPDEFLTWLKDWLVENGGTFTVTYNGDDYDVDLGNFRKGSDGMWYFTLQREGGAIAEVPLTGIQGLQPPKTGSTWSFTVSDLNGVSLGTVSATNATIEGGQIKLTATVTNQGQSVLVGNAQIGFIHREGNLWKLNDTKVVADGAQEIIVGTAKVTNLERSGDNWKLTGTVLDVNGNTISFETYVSDKELTKNEDGSYTFKSDVTGDINLRLGQIVGLLAGKGPEGADLYDKAIAALLTLHPDLQDGSLSDTLDNIQQYIDDVDYTSLENGIDEYNFTLDEVKTKWQEIADIINSLSNIPEPPINKIANNWIIPNIDDSNDKNIKYQKVETNENSRQQSLDDMAAFINTMREYAKLADEKLALYATWTAEETRKAQIDSSSDDQGYSNYEKQQKYLREWAYSGQTDKDYAFDGGNTVRESEWSEEWRSYFIELLKSAGTAVSEDYLLEQEEQVAYDKFYEKYNHNIFELTKAGIDTGNFSELATALAKLYGSTWQYSSEWETAQAQFRESNKVPHLDTNKPIIEDTPTEIDLRAIASYANLSAGTAGFINDIFMRFIDPTVGKLLTGASAEEYKTPESADILDLVEETMAQINNKLAREQKDFETNRPTFNLTGANVSAGLGVVAGQQAKNDIDQTTDEFTDVTNQFTINNQQISDSVESLTDDIQNYFTDLNRRIVFDGEITEEDNALLSIFQSFSELMAEDSPAMSQWLADSVANSQLLIESNEAQTKSFGDLIAIAPESATLIENLSTQISQIPDISSLLRSQTSNTMGVGTSAIYARNQLQLLSQQLQQIQNKPIEVKVSVSGGAEGTGGAKGNVALAAGRTLMGELGPELWVSNGHYYIAGQNGAEFVNLPKDAIVFNHLQTKKLMSSGSAGRGVAVTNERNAIARAAGTGPAMASAKEALAQLKQIRAMWQAMLGATAQELGSMAGRGGGGGSSGGNGDKFSPEIGDYERWYNWLRKIEKLEQQITLEEAKRANMMNGHAYGESIERDIERLHEERAILKDLAEQQQAFYDKRRKVQSESMFGQMFEYDEHGLMQYKPKVVESLLAKLTETDEHGNYIGAAESSVKQVEYLQKWLKEHPGENGKVADLSEIIIDPETGKKLSTTNEEEAAKIMERFWDEFDGWIEELDDLYDSYNDKLKDIQDLIKKENELLKEYVDNQLSLEEEVMKAIEAREQATIDAMTKEKDALSKAASDYISGLTQALDKERQLYAAQQDTQETSRLQRQLAILQRSGGSAAEIKSLQDQLSERLQDSYFDAQQAQIDAVKEASDAELQRLDRQIEIAQETLDYYKEHGLFNEEMQRIMQGSDDDIIGFIQQYNPKEWDALSTLASEEKLAELTKMVQLWTEDRGKEVGWKEMRDQMLQADKTLTAEDLDKYHGVYAKAYKKELDKSGDMAAARQAAQEAVKTARIADQQALVEEVKTETTTTTEPEKPQFESFKGTITSGGRYLYEQPSESSKIVGHIGPEAGTGKSFTVLDYDPSHPGWAYIKVGKQEGWAKLTGGSIDLETQRKLGISRGSAPASGQKKKTSGDGTKDTETTGSVWDQYTQQYISQSEYTRRYGTQATYPIYNTSNGILPEAAINSTEENVQQNTFNLYGVTVNANDAQEFTDSLMLEARKQGNYV